MNIQQTIIEGIRLQLHRHAFVVLPGFGGFVLKQRPSHFTPSGTQLCPPTRTVSFNSQLRQDDGILASWLVEKQGCSGNQALSHLHDFAGYCRGVLDNRRRLSLPGIGFFFLDFENNLCFEPLADQNFFPGSFGLTAVRVPVNNPMRRAAPDYADRPAPTTAVRPRPRRIARQVAIPLLATAFVLAFLAVLLSVGDFRGQLRAAFAGGNISATYRPTAQAPLQLERPAGELQPLVSDANGVAVLRLPEITVPVKVPAGAGAETSEYEIVLGCFAVPENAERLVQRMKSKSIAAHILGERHRGMQVVAYGGFPDKASAGQQLERVRAYVPEAWIRPAR